MRQRSWSEKELREAVSSSRSYGQILVRLGLRPAGANYQQITKYIKEYNLDTAHLLGRGWKKGGKFPNVFKIPLEKILIEESDYQSFKLKNRLFSANLKPRHCEMCGWAQTTQDGYLPLELDHINGNHRDNRLVNLRILCPNCHSLQPTHRGRKQR